MPSWQRTLLIVWCSQFLSICGFSLALPFAPFFIQELGVSDPDAIKYWSALSASATAVSLAVMAPIWGMLADRYGRKLMMMRANWGGFVVLCVMGFAPNVHVFILLRLLQGVFTGTVSAAMTFVATSTPHNRQGLALGSLSAAVSAGNMIGPLLGGVLADSIGYRATFIVSSALLLISGLLVLFLVKEQFVPPEPEQVGRHVSWRERIEALGPGAPILVLLFFIAVARSFDGPILPLYVQQLHGRLEGASRWTGALSGVSAVGATLAGLWLGRLCDRTAPPLIGRLSAVGSGLFMGLTGLVSSLPLLFPVRFALSFCAGGLDPVFQVWLSRITPPSRRGTIFGWSATAKSIGWAIAPLLSGVTAVAFNMSMVFLIGAVLFMVLVPMIDATSRRVVKLEG